MAINNSKKTALKFVILLGIVSLFADMTYEGARSITGQYLAILGATGTVVGFVSGFGEFIGYSFRLVSGYLSDRSGKYWSITIIGYAINLIAVPLLAMAGSWPLAASLIILERFGKAFRSPAGHALLSYAAHQTGRGFGFGLHEAMDQTGAILGPLMISLVLYFQGTYQMSFAMLAIPAACSLVVLLLARQLYPKPENLEIDNPDLQSTGFSKKFWIYIIAISFIGAGYVDFPLIAFHYEKLQSIPAAWIPILFAIAMAADGAAALIFGRLYDKIGLKAVLIATVIAAFFVPFVFLGGFGSALIGMILWGIGLGSQESIMRAIVADLVPKDRRATAYGIMNMFFGVCWFLGSALMGYFYDVSLVALIVFSMAAQLVSVPFLLAVSYRKGLK